MAYGADFATADAANAPLDAPLMIGADPVLWGGLLLGLAAALLVGWLVGQNGKTSRPDAAESIWEDIDDAAREAMKANADNLSAKASALLRTIERRLGKTLGMAGGAGGITEALKKALDGEPAHKPHGDHDPDTGHEDKHGHHDAPPPAASGVTVIVNNGKSEGHKGADDHPGDHGAKTPLGVQARNDALRLAIGHFNDHWGQRRDRVRELRAAHAELSTPGSKHPAAGRISGTRAGH
ncbi:hypothetical protein [Brevundimonas sp.]|uniref:hypothetical protein n=1 Tax=Brevundimonas sp. TaxID=1871086 RepID=UPI002FC9208A